MKYTDLIFDLYGTLVDIHTEENYVGKYLCRQVFLRQGTKSTNHKLCDNWTTSI